MSGDVAIQALIHLLVIPASVGVATWKARDKPARRFWPGFALTAITILVAPAVLVKLGSGTDAEMWSFAMRIAALISAAPILATVAGRLCRRIRSKVAFAAIVGASYVVAAVAGVAVVFREPSPRWVTFESTKGGFALEMPGAPDCSSTRHATETATWHGIACRARIESPFDRFGGEVTFLVSSRRISSPPSSAASRARRCCASSTRPRSGPEAPSWPISRSARPLRRATTPWIRSRRKRSCSRGFQRFSPIDRRGAVLPCSKRGNSAPCAALASTRWVCSELGATCPRPGKGC